MDKDLVTNHNISEGGGGANAVLDKIDTLRGTQGYVNIEPWRTENGRRVPIPGIEGRNLVVFGGRSAAAHLFAGDTQNDGQGRWVKYISVGTGGAMNDQNGLPTRGKGEVLGAESLYSGSPLIQKSVSYDFPLGDNGNQVRFSIDLLESEANASNGDGQPISEVGLVGADGTFLAHKTFGIITKTPSLGLTIRWTLIF